MNCIIQQQVEGLLDHADRLLQAGDAGGAVKAANKAITKLPGHLQSRIIHAKALLQMNQPDDAIDSLDDAEMYIITNSEQATTDQRIDLLLLRSEAMGRLNQKEESIQVLENARMLDIDNSEILKRLTGLKMENQQHAQAIALCKDWLHLQPDNPQALRTLAQAYELIGCGDLALGIYEKLDQLRTAEQSPQSRINLDASSNLKQARLHRQANDLATASYLYDCAIENDSDDPQLLIEAAEIAIELADDMKVQFLLNRALANQPSNLVVLRLLAEQHMRCGRFTKAAWLWWKIYRNTRTLEIGATGLLTCAICTNRTKLMARLEEILTSNNNNQHRRKAMMSRVWKLAMKGRLLTNLLHRNNDNLDNDLLPTLLAETGNIIESQLTDHPNHADLHYHLAISQITTSKTEAAANSLDRALGINGTYLSAARQRIELLILEDNLTAAMAILKAFRYRRKDTAALFDLELTLIALKGNTSQALNLLGNEQSKTHDANETARAVYHNLLQHDSRLAGHWNHACAKHPHLTEPRVWSHAA